MLAEELRVLSAKLEVRTGQQEEAAKKLRNERTAAERERLKLEIENKGVGGEKLGGNLLFKLCYSDSDTTRNICSASASRGSWTGR